MSLNKRYMEFMKKKGRAPEEQMLYEGGEVHEMDDKDVAMDDEWNEHDDDTSGEPKYFAEGGAVEEPSIWDNLKANLSSGSAPDKKKPWGGYAFGGEIHAPEHGNQSDEMSDKEAEHMLALALKRRKQLRPGA